MRIFRISLSVVFSLPLFSQHPQTLEPAVRKYVTVDASRVVLEHVRVIDGTGKPPLEDRNIVIENGKIAAVQPGADVSNKLEKLRSTSRVTPFFRASSACTITCFMSRDPTSTPQAIPNRRCLFLK